MMMMASLLTLGMIFSCAAGIAGGNCIVPATQVCHVTYLVPRSIALLASVLEREISSAYNSDMAQNIGETCAQSLKEVRCAKSFPRCSSDSTNVTVTSLDCQQRLQCATSTYRAILTGDHFCDLTEKTFPFAGCKPATQYGYTFNYCPMSVTRNVTEWMFALLQYQDVVLSSTSTFLSSNYPTCAASNTYYQCIKIGQCDGCATNMIVNYTRVQCNTFTSVCSSAMIYMPDCNLWPSEVARLPCNDTTINVVKTVTIGSPIGTMELPSSTSTTCISSSQTAEAVGATRASTNCNLPASISSQAAETTQCLATIISTAIFATLGIATFTAGIILIIIALVLIQRVKKGKHYAHVHVPVAKDGSRLELTLSS